MIQFAQLCVTRFAPGQSARCSAKRRPALNALSIVNNLNALFVAPKICVRRIRAPNVRQCVLRPNVEQLASPLRPTVHLCARKLSATGLALSLQPAHDLNVSSNARSPSATSPMKRRKPVVAHALALTSPQLLDSLLPMLKSIRL